jgi:hypothetical protein
MRACRALANATRCILAHGGEEFRAGAGAGGGAQRSDKAVHGDYEDVVLGLFDGPARDAQDGECAVWAPAPAMTGQPGGLFDDFGEVVVVVGAGLSLDREGEAGRCDRDVVDVAAAGPSDRVA